MFIQILGTGGAVPTPERSPAAYWVEVDGHGLLLDPGPGAVLRLLRSPVGPSSIDGIDRVLLTHLHLDHCADLAPLLFAWHSPLAKGRDAIRIVGPVGLAGYLDALRGIHGDSLTPSGRRLDVLEMRPGETFRPADGSIGAGNGGTRVEAFAADHSQSRLSRECLIFRFVAADGRRIVFSGDTGPTAGLDEAARGAELLVVECSCPDELATPGHLTPAAVARLCAEARPGRVVLTHLYPPAAALDLPALIGATFDGTVVTAGDGDIFTVESDEVRE